MCVFMHAQRVLRVYLHDLISGVNVKEFMAV